MAVELYAPFISKSVQAGPGGRPVALLVTGKVTGSGIDLDDQIVDFEWAAKALQEWYARAGNIREMHQSKAIGKAVDLMRSDDGDGFDVTAKITDPEAMQKVLDGVLQGFSIGIKRRASDPPIVVRDRVAKGGRIQAGLISEISLVDAPAYPAARVANVETLWKMAGTEADDLLDEEVPEPDALPEPAVADLTKAVADAERKSPPKGYPEDKSEYADPDRFGFPIDTPARVRSAMAYFNAGKGKGEQGRTEADWQSIGRKIASAANDDFGPGHSLKDGTITHDDDETKKSLTETLSGVIPVLVDGDGAPVLGNVRWITKADGNREAVAGDLSYDPFPTEERNGFTPPPDPSSDGAFTDTSQALAKDAPATPNGLSLIPGPNDAAHFQPVDNPPTPSVPVELIPTPANTLAGDSGGFTHQDASQLAKALSANVDALLATGDADIVKNGVARALGPTATSLLYQMLSNEVEEDGGTGSMACDIAAIACAYDKLVCFIQSELAEEGDVPMIGKAATATDAARAFYDLACSLDPALATVQAGKTVRTDDLVEVETVKALRAENERLATENAELQKTLDATPVPDGPQKTLLAPPAQATVAQVDIDAALARFANEQEPRAKREALAHYLTLTQPH